MVCFRPGFCKVHAVSNSAPSNNIFFTNADWCCRMQALLLPHFWNVTQLGPGLFLAHESLGIPLLWKVQTRFWRKTYYAPRPAIIACFAMRFCYGKANLLAISSIRVLTIP